MAAAYTDTPHIGDRDVGFKCPYRIKFISSFNLFATVCFTNPVKRCNFIKVY
jgi:hypothetical protein